MEILCYQFPKNNMIFKMVLFPWLTVLSHLNWQHCSVIESIYLLSALTESRKTQAGWFHLSFIGRCKWSGSDIWVCH